MEDVFEGNDTDGNTTSTYYDFGLPVVATLSFFLVVSMILALVGNVMVITTILRHRGMRTRTNMLLGNLAVADIMVAVLDMPVALVTIINHDWIFGDTFCIFNGFAVGLGLMLSVHTLMWISIHKYSSITRPFARNVTQFQIVLMMVAAWVWTIMYNLTATPLIGMTEIVYKKGSSQCGPTIPKNMLGFVHSSLNTIFNLVIPMIVMFYCYYRIFDEVKTHLERMRDFADVGMRNSYIQQKQITITLFIVLIVFFMFWLPYIVYSMSLVFCGKDCVPLIFNPISYLFGYMNSACNPVIYALRSPSFRRGFKEIIFGTSSPVAEPSRIPRGSESTYRKWGIAVSFRNSIFRRTVRERNRPVRSRHAAAPPGRADQVPEVVVVPSPQPVSPEANGEACQVEATEVEPVSAFETGPPHVSSEDGNHTLPDRPSFFIDSEYSYEAWQPLKQQFAVNHLSKSCQEIVTSTSGIMTRSASAGAIPVMVNNTKETQKQPDVAPKRRHRSEVHRPLMWQASLDHITVSLVGRKRRESAGERMTPQQKHLRVRKMIRNFRKSFSDLFSIEEH